MTRMPRIACLAAAALALAAAPSTQAQPATAAASGERNTFKVCQDPNNMPFSNPQGEGIENRIAELFAKDLGLPVSYYSFPQRLAFVRNTLRYKLPGEDFRCDIIMGVPSGFDQVSVTKPYYRSTYALVFPKGGALEGVKSTNDLLSLPPDTLKKLRIGVGDRSPATEWLKRHDLVDQGVPFPMLSPDPGHYPGQLIERELAEGRVDAAIVWGPIAGWFAQRVKNRDLVVVPMVSEKGVKFDFPMAMGVRYGEPQWKQQIEALIEKRRPEIQAILRDFGVPVLELESASATSSAR
jgi:mxaJ protein